MPSDPAGDVTLDAALASAEANADRLHGDEVGQPGPDRRDQFDSHLARRCTRNIVHDEVIFTDHGAVTRSDPGQPVPPNGWEYDRHTRLVRAKDVQRPDPNQPVRWSTVLWLLVPLGVLAVMTDLIGRWTTLGPINIMICALGSSVVNWHCARVRHRWSALGCGIPAVVILPMLAEGLLSPGVPAAYAWAIGSFAAAAVYTAVTHLPSRQKLKVQQ